MWVDYDQEQRRLDRYSDLSRSAFVLGMIALAIVGAAAIYALWPN